jgi:hypothetical protein
MTGERPLRDKLRKVKALAADAAATDGEKAAADAAAERIGAKSRRLEAERRIRLAQRQGDVMYLLGRAFRRLLSKL